MNFMSIGRLIFHVESQGTNPVNMATNQSSSHKNVEKDYNMHMTF